MKKILYIIIASMMFASCSESFLDVEPTKSIPVSKAFSTPAAVKAAVNGVYFTLSNYKGNGRYNIMSADVRGDDMMIPQENNWNQFLNQYNYGYEPTNSSGNTMYLRAYEVIEGCNSILDAEASGAIKLDADTKNPLLGEVKAVRALCYFNLVRFFCETYTKDNGESAGVPLKVTADPSILKGRGKVKDVYKQILEDLTFAVTYLPVGEAMADHVNKTFAQGLLARVYMTMGNNLKAIEFADKALIAHPYKADYSKGLTQKNSTLIFSIEYTKNTYAKYGSLQSFYDFGFADGGGYGTLGATPTIVSKYETNDIRMNWFLNQWVYSNVVETGSFKNSYKKFITEISATKESYEKAVEDGLMMKGLWDETTNSISAANLDKLERRVWTPKSGFNSHVSMYGKFPRIDAVNRYKTDAMGAQGSTNLGNVPIMRTAEMVLIKAECLAMNKDYAAAKSALDLIRVGAGLASYSGSVDASILEAIRLERRKELLGEGFRVFDIIRQGKAVKRADYWGDAKYETIDPKDVNSKIIMPFPKKEIDANSEMTANDQNPAYK